MKRSPGRSARSINALSPSLERRQSGWSRRALEAPNAGLALREWFGEARHAQYPLWRHDADPPAHWLVLGGRGSGKTRLGAEWVHALARGFPPFAENGDRYRQIALVGETFADVREVMIEGPSGIRSIARAEPPRYEPSRRRLLWTTGAVAQAFSSEDPDSLRGPQFAAAWSDEAAKWKNAEETFDMLQFGLRLAPGPRQIVTSTPRPVPLVRRLMADPNFEVTRMRTEENADNLAAGFISAVRNRYGGTRLGRQELDGELVDDRPDALWTRAALEAARGPRGELRRIVVAVDPPATSRRSSDACGIVVAGRDESDRAVILADATLSAARPQDWARRVAAVYAAHEADCVVAEVNQGGDMVATVLRMIDPTLPVREVRASRGKWLRAEPVAALYAQGRVIHAAPFLQLEDEMCDFGHDGLSGGRSPDRVDALVWAVTELLLGRGEEPRVRMMGR